MRSVKTWPRSRSRATWISSIGEELDGAIERHRLDGADEIRGAVGHDLFFAGDQRHRVLALGFDHPVIDLARQQPQRQADHAGSVTEHALDGEMGFAGIGRPKDSFGPGAVAHELHDGSRPRRFQAGGLPGPSWGKIPE